jgi:hypothetical protein
VVQDKKTILSIFLFLKYVIVIPNTLLVILVQNVSNPCYQKCYQKLITYQFHFYTLATCNHATFFTVINPKGKQTKVKQRLQQMNPILCLQSVLALNNLGVSLARKNWLEHAIQVFIKTVNMFCEDTTPVHTSALLNTANQFHEFRQLLPVVPISPDSYANTIIVISADKLIRHIRGQFRDDFDVTRVEQKTSHALHLIYFTETIDLSEPGAWEAVVAIIFYNLGTAHFAASSAKEEKVNTVLAAHYLWEYSAFLCERVIYENRDASVDWITFGRCLLLLLYRCLQDTSTVLNLEEEKDDLFSSYVAESASLWGNELFREYCSQTVAEAA